MRFQAHTHVLSHLILQHKKKSDRIFHEHIPLRSSEIARSRKLHILSETQEQLRDIQTILLSHPHLEQENPERYMLLKQQIDRLQSIIEKKK